MSINIAINGYGRIGRNILKAIYEYNQNDFFKVVAINSSGNNSDKLHLTKYDSTHGKFKSDVSLDGDCLVINGDKIKLVNDRNPANLPWKELDVDVVFECTGAFKTKESCNQHIQSGAKKVIISAPGGSDIDATIVYGVNNEVLSKDFTVISNASCTTNCLAPIVKVLNDTVGIDSGLMTTIHAFTNDQVLVDSFHSDMRRARSATSSMIPTSTGAAAAVGLVLPELQGKLDGFAMRVPTINVSVVDLTFKPNKVTNVAEINSIIKEYSEKSMKGILDYNDEPLVSIDFNHSPYASIFDSTQTRVGKDLVKVLSWYDNEWGFCCQMLRTTKYWMSL